MNKLTISLGILLVVIFEALSLPTFSANDDGTVSALLDPDDYDNSNGAWSGMMSKRFWSPHPSDYNPLRRPVPVPRGSKRDGEVYHPIPRVITIKHRSPGPENEEYPESTYEEVFAGGRQKKQTRPTTLIFRLGSLGFWRNKDKNVVPATPPPNSS